MLFIFVPTILLAAPAHPLVLCLGSEEAQIHKNKISGPIYQLNLGLIDLFSSIEIPPIDSKIFQDICSKEHFSQILLERIILENREIVNFSNNADLKRHQTNLFDHMFDLSKMAFFKLIADYQAQTPMAECLEKIIPGFSDFQIRYKSLESEDNYQLAKDDKAIIKTIFQTFKNFNSEVLKCQKKPVNNSEVAPLHNSKS